MGYEAQYAGTGPGYTHRNMRAGAQEMRREARDRSDKAVGDGRKQFYSSAVRGRMETQSAGSFQLRWQPLGDSMGIAPKLQGRGRARSSVHGGSVSVLYLFWEMNLRTH